MPTVLAKPKSFFPPDLYHFGLSSEIFVASGEVFEVSQVLVALLDARGQDLLVSFHIVISLHVTDLGQQRILNREDVLFLEDGKSHTLSLVSVIELHHLNRSFFGGLFLHRNALFLLH